MNPENTNSLLPTNKYDVAVAQRIQLTSYSSISPILSELLEWIKDGNWPVAKALAPVLATYDSLLVPDIITILRGDDNIWKYWILTDLVTLLNTPSRKELTEECLRIVESPTEGELVEGVNLAAQQVLSQK